MIDNFFSTPNFFFTFELIKMMKTEPYPLATDGSNDEELIKMNPLTVQYLILQNMKFPLNYWISVVQKKVMQKLAVLV